MILLDTCAVVWDALETGQLTPKALKAISKAEEHNALMVSDITLWEISMLIKKQRIQVETSAANFINLCLHSRSISVVPISAEIAERSTGFGSEINNDPADRIIAATAIIHNAQLVTADKSLRGCEIVDTIW